jgi:hypothetical protein
LAGFVITPSLEAQVALFAPYCGGRQAEPALRRALELWSHGLLEGIRPMLATPGHRFRLQWHVVEAPLLTSACVLTLDSEPRLCYRFTLPAHQLITWLMQLRSGDGSGPDFSDRFWQWLLLEAPVERCLADSLPVERNENAEEL